MKKILILSVLFTFCAFIQAIAQRIPKATRDDNQVIKNLTNRTDKSGWLYYKNGLKLNHQSLLNDNKDAFGLTPNDVMKIDKEQTDELGGKHLRLKQYYKGVKVEDADYVLHYDRKGNLTHSNGQLGEEIDNNTNVIPSISESEALAKSVAALDGLKPIWLEPTWEQRIKREKEDSSATYKPKGKLLLVLSDNRKYNLAYVFDIETINPSGDWKVYIDARNRQIIKKLSNIQQCTPVAITFTSLYNGVQGVLGRRAGWFSSWRGLETCNNEVNAETVHTDGSAVVNNSDSWGTYQQQFTSAHWAVDQSWNYFKDKFNRSGWDGNHKKVLTKVEPNNFGNIAFYSPANQTLNIFKDIMSLDITGHEYTHGLTHHTSMLGGTGESGALNESFSDIFGVLINRYATGNINWSIGTEIPWGAVGFTVIRDLANPTNSCCAPVQNASASIFGGANWFNTADISDANDRGGIHHNNGVQNRWFNLLSVGGFQNNTSVQGIGIDKAAGISYHNLTTQLTSNSNFQAAANGATAAAEALYGCNSFELEQTRLAWQAVGVNPPQPQLNLFGQTNICSESYFDTYINFDACWRFGTNYTWSYPSQFSGTTYGNGNSTLALTIPANENGYFQITVTGNFNGIVQTQSLWLSVSNCGGQYYSVKPNTHLTQSNQFTLSPNPTSDIVNITLPNGINNAIFDAELYNSLGQLVYKRKITNSDNRLEISELPKGFYNVILRNTSDKKVVFTNKLTKM